MRSEKRAEKLNKCHNWSDKKGKIKNKVRKNENTIQVYKYHYYYINCRSIHLYMQTINQKENTMSLKFDHWTIPNVYEKNKYLSFSPKSHGTCQVSFLINSMMFYLDWKQIIKKWLYFFVFVFFLFSLVNLSLSVYLYMLGDRLMCMFSPWRVGFVEKDFFF